VEELFLGTVADASSRGGGSVAQVVGGLLALPVSEAGGGGPTSTPEEWGSTVVEWVSTVVEGEHFLAADSDSDRWDESDGWITKAWKNSREAPHTRQQSATLNTGQLIL
jgi:hypothetical protein